MHQNLLNYADQLVLIMNQCSKKKFSWERGIILMGWNMSLCQGSFFATVLHWLLKYLFCCLLLHRLVQHTGFHTPLLSEDWCSELFSSRGGFTRIFQNKIPSFRVTLTLLIPFNFHSLQFSTICQHLQKKRMLLTPLFQSLNGC